MNGPGSTLGLTCQPDAAKDLGSNFRCSNFTAPDVDRQPNHPARQVKGKHLRQAALFCSDQALRRGGSDLGIDFLLKPWLENKRGELEEHRTTCSNFT